MKSPGTPTRPAAPDGLDEAGRDLWTRMVDDLDDDLELDARGLADLEAACRLQDDAAQLQTLIEKHGRVARKNGRVYLNPAVSELRQARIAVARLLGGLGLGDNPAQPETAASQRAKRAAHAKWGTAPGPGRGQLRAVD